MSGEKPSGEELPGRAKGLDVVEATEVPVLFVDWIVTAGEYDGVINITFGTVDHTHTAHDGAARVLVASKLRMSRPFAEHLLRWLLSAPKDDEEAPEAPQNPPPNKLH
ncbi:MAG: hypothetical protein AAFW98_01260 [Pseudomonadota bacterium]